MIYVKCDIVNKISYIFLLFCFLPIFLYLLCALGKPQDRKKCKSGDTVTIGVGNRLSNSDFQCATKCSAKICRKDHKTQKKCVKMSKIRLKEVTFTVLRSKVRILRRLWIFLRRCASVCLPLLETLSPY